MKFTIFTARTAFLSAQLSSVKYTHTVEQPISTTVSFCKSETTTFSACETQTSKPIKQEFPHFPVTPPLVTTVLPSVSMNLTSLMTSDK